MVAPAVGRPLAVTDVAVVEPDSYRLAEPGPVVPRERKYAVTPVPALQVKVGEDPANTLPGVGPVRVAGVAACPQTGRQKNAERTKAAKERRKRTTGARPREGS